MRKRGRENAAHSPGASKFDDCFMIIETPIGHVLKGAGVLLTAFFH